MNAASRHSSVCAVRRALLFEQLEGRRLLAVAADVECAIVEPSQFDDLQFDVAENSIAGTVIGSVGQFDADAGQRVVIKEGNESGIVALDDTTGVLTVTDSDQLDFETTAEFEFVVSVVDPCGEVGTVAVTVAIADRNDAPTLSLDNIAVDENLLGAPIGQLKINDQDLQGDYQFHVWDDRFEMVDDVLMLKEDACLVCEEADTVTVFVTVLDPGDPLQVYTQAFEITVNENPYPWHSEEAPFDVNCDGITAPLDVLIMINKANMDGAYELGGRPARPGVPVTMYDTSGDGGFSPLDILLVINHFNSQHQLDDAEGEGSVEPATEFAAANSASAGQFAFATTVAEAPVSAAPLQTQVTSTQIYDESKWTNPETQADREHVFALLGSHDDAGTETTELESTISSFANDLDDAWNAD